VNRSNHSPVALPRFIRFFVVKLSPFSVFLGEKICFVTVLISNSLVCLLKTVGLLVRLHIRQLVHKVHKLDWLFGTDEKHHPVTIGVPL
jgi:hypothetical protein